MVLQAVGLPRKIIRAEFDLKAQPGCIAPGLVRYSISCAVAVVFLFVVIHPALAGEPLIGPKETVQKAADEVIRIGKKKIRLAEKEKQLCQCVEDLFDVFDISNFILVQGNAVYAANAREFSRVFKEYACCRLTGKCDPCKENDKDCKLGMSLMEISQNGSFIATGEIRKIPDFDSAEVSALASSSRFKNVGMVFSLKREGDRWRVYDLTVQQTSKLTDELRKELRINGPQSVDSAIQKMKREIDKSNQRMVQE